MIKCLAIIQIGNVQLVFEERGKLECPEENLSERGRGTNNKLNPHMTLSLGIAPGPHWWEASALSNASSLLPCTVDECKSLSNGGQQWGPVLLTKATQSSPFFTFPLSLAYKWLPASLGTLKIICRLYL